MSNSRLEKFIYAICGMDVGDLPTPLSRIETLWNCLITGGMPDFEPLSRNEKYLMAMLTDNVDGLPEPTSRGEKLLYKIATGETDLSDVPGYLSRYEELLKQLIENGGIGGTDFEYVLYTLNESFSTLYSTAEAPVKSAILKGSTKYRDIDTGEVLDAFEDGRNLELVSVRMPVLKTTGNNLFDFKNAQWLKGGNFNPTYGNSGNILIENMSLKLSNPSSCVGTIVNGLKPNTEYYVTAKVTNTSPMFINSGLSYGVNNTTINGGINRKLTTNSNGELAISIGVYNANTNGGYVLVENIQVEEGSVATTYGPYKTNILTTTSKNLFDMNRPYDAITDNQATVVQDTDQITVSSAESGIYVNANFILDKDFFAGKTVTGSCLYESDEKDIGTVQITYQDGNGEYHYQWIKTPRTFTFPNSFIGDVMLSISANNTGTPQSNTVTVKNIQLELGSTATSYEPYSEVVLRGIGDVKDELNLLTGEVVERTGEIVLNGNESWWFADSPDNPENTGTWTHSENTWLLGVDFTTISSNTHPVKNTISDKYPVYYNYSFSDSEYFNIVSNNNSLLFRVRKDRFSDKSITNFKSWLSQNPITIQYQLTTESVKTVVLSTLDQDGQPTKLSTFNDITHVSIEAEDLLPTVDLEVPTKIEETLSTLPTLMNDISETQQLLNESIDDQAENINEVSTAITEIRSDIL